jgi:Skp family chaperone for outer membrane proteins
MIRYRFATILIASALATGLAQHNPCLGKEATTSRHAPTVVVVLNVGKLFTESKQFTAELAKMKAEVTKAEENVKKQRDKLKTQREEMEKLPVTSEERSKQEEQLSKVEAALAASVTFQKGAFLRQEAAIYANFYQRVQNEVEGYAKEAKIDLVLRTKDQTFDASKPDSILQHINRDVVWTSADADITAVIAERLANHKDLPHDDDDK